jgi:hypothetical protein
MNSNNFQGMERLLRYRKYGVEHGYRKDTLLKSCIDQTADSFNANQKGRFPANLLVEDVSNNKR